MLPVIDSLNHGGHEHHNAHYRFVEETNEVWLETRIAVPAGGNLSITRAAARNLHLGERCVARSSRRIAAPPQGATWIIPRARSIFGAFALVLVGACPRAS